MVSFSRAVLRFLSTQNLTLISQIQRNRVSSNPSQLITFRQEFSIHTNSNTSTGVWRRFSTTSQNQNDRIKINEQHFQTKSDVEEFLGQLSMEQKSLLFSQLNLNILAHQNQYGESGYEIHHYLSKFGRPSTYVDEIDDAADRSISKSLLHQPNSPPGVDEIRLQNEELQHIPPTRGDVWAVGLKNALPFVGFGFLDNLIMIVAGDYIDTRIGTVLGISTMAAAALGNTISDVAGIASAWYVEHFAEKFGIHTPKLTPFQANSWQVRWAINAGRAIGVTIGCLLGMIPLIFLPIGSKSEEKDGVPKNRTKD